MKMKDCKGCFSDAIACKAKYIRKSVGKCPCIMCIVKMMSCAGCHDFHEFISYQVYKAEKQHDENKQ